MIDEISSQAGLASFRGTPQPAPEVYTIFQTTNLDAVTVVTASGVAQTIHREDADPEHRFTAYRLAAAYFGNLPQTPEPEPVTIYAAVIEWPSGLDDIGPALVLARTAAERDAQIAEEIADTAWAITGPDWRDAIDANSTPEGNNWRDWLDPLEETSYGRPFITIYEREV